MPGHAGRKLLPRIAGLGHAEAEIVELGHIDGVEGLRAGVVKIARDVRKIVVDVVFSWRTRRARKDRRRPGF